MVPSRRNILLVSMKMFDAANVGFSFVVADMVSMGGFRADVLFSNRVAVVDVAFFFALVFIWHLIFSRFGIYYSRRLSTWRDQLKDIVKATSAGTFAIFIISLFSNKYAFTNTFLATYFVVYLCIALLSRLVMYSLLRSIRLHGRNLRNMIIVGTNSRAIHLARSIESRPELGYRIIGFVDNQWGMTPDFYKTNYELLANLDELPNLLREHVVDEIVISLPLKSFYQQMSEIVSLCEQQGIIVRLFSDMFDLKIARAKVDVFDGNAMIIFNTGNIEGWSVLVKRFMDVSISLSLLIWLSPLMVVVGLLIKFTSPGPVLFTQERLGLNKRRFKMYKFRTMHQDAEKVLKELETRNEADGPVFKIRNDPRVTPLGKFLRKTSIDELPQLINVIKGDISLVGPRPLPVRDYLGFNEDWHRRRFSVRPGITCLWQVSGRSNISFSRWMELDMEYIDHWSLGLDLKILLKTIPAVLRGVGAV